MPSTLNPAGCAANFNGFFHLPMLIGEEISYEYSWNLLLSYILCSLTSKKPVVRSQPSAEVLIGATLNVASALSNAWISPNAADSSPKTGSPARNSPSIISTLRIRPRLSQSLIIPNAVYVVVDVP